MVRGLVRREEGTRSMGDLVFGLAVIKAGGEAEGSGDGAGGRLRGRGKWSEGGWMMGGRVRFCDWVSESVSLWSS